jgi:hypothetical protein
MPGGILLSKDWLWTWIVSNDYIEYSKGGVTMRSIFEQEFILRNNNIGLYLRFKPVAKHESERENLVKIYGTILSFKKYDRIPSCKGILVYHTDTKAAEMVWTNVSGEPDILYLNDFSKFAEAILRNDRSYKRCYYKAEQKLHPTFQKIPEEVQNSKRLIKRTYGLQKVVCRWIETASGMVVVEPIRAGLSTLVFASLTQFLDLTYGGRIIGDKISKHPDVLFYRHRGGEIHPEVKRLLQQLE